MVTKIIPWWAKPCFCFLHLQYRMMADIQNVNMLLVRKLQTLLFITLLGIKIEHLLILYRKVHYLFLISFASMLLFLNHVMQEQINLLFGNDKVTQLHISKKPLMQSCLSFYILPLYERSPHQIIYFHLFLTSLLVFFKNIFEQKF